MQLRLASARRSGVLCSASLLKWFCCGSAWDSAYGTGWGGILEILGRWVSNPPPPRPHPNPNPNPNPNQVSMAGTFSRSAPTIDPRPHPPDLPWSRYILGVRGSLDLLLPSAALCFGMRTIGIGVDVAARHG